MTDDIRVSTAIRKYGEFFGHEFNNNERCRFCGMPRNEFYHPSSGIAGKGILCQENPKVINDHYSKPKNPRIQKITKQEFWELLYDWYARELKNNRLQFFHSFKETFEYFWDVYKINRSTFTKLFNEIYHEQYHLSKNRLHCYGAPDGSYRDRDRLSMNTTKGYREWSLWGLDDFDEKDSKYKIEKKGLPNLSKVKD